MSRKSKNSVEEIKLKIQLDETSSNSDEEVEQKKISIACCRPGCSKRKPCISCIKNGISPEIRKKFSKTDDNLSKFRSRSEGRKLAKAKEAEKPKKSSKIQESSCESLKKVVITPPKTKKRRSKSECPTKIKPPTPCPSLSDCCDDEKSQSESESENCDCEDSSDEKPPKKPSIEVKIKAEKSSKNHKKSKNEPENSENCDCDDSSDVKIKPEKSSKSHKKSKKKCPDPQIYQNLPMIPMANFMCPCCCTCEPRMSTYYSSYCRRRCNPDPNSSNFC